LNQSHDFYVTAPIKKSILKDTLIMSFGIFIIFSFNFVDAFFISRLGITELTAFSYTFPILNLLTSIGLALSVGNSSIIGNLIGQKKLDTAKKTLFYSIIFTILIGIICTLIGVSTVEPLFTSLGATPLELTHIKSYIYIWYSGFIFVLFTVVGNTFLTSIGDAKSPGLIMVGSGIINMIIDPILIFGLGPIPSLGIKGAAMATIFARFIGVVGIFYCLFKKSGMHHEFKKSWAEARTLLRPIISISMPNMINFTLVPLSLFIMTWLVSKLGDNYVGIFGVYNRVEILGTVFYFGIGSVLGAYIAQNYGANEKKRVLEGLLYACKVCIGWGIIVSLIIALFAEYIALIFLDDQQLLSESIFSLRTIPFGFVLLGVTISIGVAFNALKSPMHANIIAFIRTFVCTLPLCYLGYTQSGFQGFCVGTMGGYLLSGLFSVVYAKIYLKKLI